MMAFATKGSWVMGSGEMQEDQQPAKISEIISRFLPISPSRSELIFGMSPGFLTMYFVLSDPGAKWQSSGGQRTAISSDGSPPIG